MNFSVDHAFHIGSMHERAAMPCQDYAMSGKHRDMAVAVISDGCSSGGRTDFGARIVCQVTAQAIGHAHSLFERPRHEEVVTSQRSALLAQRGSLDLDKDDMLATCGYAFIHRSGYGHVHLTGDGAIAVRAADGGILMRRTSWDENMPPYPIYDALDRYAGFKERHGGDDAIRALQNTVVYGADGGLFSYSEYRVSVATGIRGMKVDICPKAPVSCLAVFTDGIEQVPGMSWHAVVHNLMSFKTPAGEFSKRRLRRFISDARSRDGSPVDDIGFAAILVDEHGAA